ncbi:MAG: hypothetical protein JWO58_1659 [Chitinophagaceae bacterium]|nr:hypothetical protein [Chitinophagaceae bacterium]
MCGIAFIIGGEKKTAFDFAERANRLLQHRGPDGQGIFQDEYITLAHRRLAIIDLSDAGAQPMHSSDQRYVIVHNGEIYNHRELRTQFLPDTRFAGHSDTETLLALYAQLGETMLQHLVGMWAFAIWDTVKQTVFISRDRYGQKPLYYRKATDGTLRFASEIKPLLEEGERPSMNETAVVEYLALGNYGHLGPHTFFKEIFQFKPGHYATIGVNEKDFHETAYWSLPFVREQDKVPFDEQQQDKLKVIIEEAVRSQLLSDVTVGATLSGGIDSSIVVGAMSMSTDNIIPVFTAQSKGSKWDESVYVRAVETKWGSDKVNVHWKELNNTQLSLSLPHYIAVQEEPFGDPSIMAHGFLMDMAKENKVKVVLGGQGADELFFGYGSLISPLLSQGLRRGKLFWVKNNLNKMNLPLSEIGRVLLSAFAPKLEQAFRKRSRRKRRSFIAQKVLSKVDDRLVQLAKPSDFYSVWNESVYGVHLPHLVHYDDRNGMSHSIEGRMPFLDHRIAEHVAHIQSHTFLMDGKSKSILRMACSSLIPQKILERRDKIGFYTPLHDMLKNDISWIENTLCSFKDIDTFIVTEVWKEDVAFYKGEGESMERALRLWRILSFVVWVNTFHIHTDQV